MNPILSLQQQRLLLEIEYNTEREAYRRQTESMGLMRKVKRGDAWYPIRGGRSYYNSLNQLVVEVHRTQDDDIEHNFEYGRPVCFFHMSGDGKGGEKITLVVPAGSKDAYKKASQWKKFKSIVEK